MPAGGQLADGQHPLSVQVEPPGPLPFQGADLAFHFPEDLLLQGGGRKPLDLVIPFRQATLEIADDVPPPGREGPQGRLDRAHVELEHLVKIRSQLLLGVRTLAHSISPVVPKDGIANAVSE
jgi:hypothetical protein